MTAVDPNAVAIIKQSYRNVPRKQTLRQLFVHRWLVSLDKGCAPEPI